MQAATQPVTQWFPAVWVMITWTSRSGTGHRTPAWSEQHRCWEKPKDPWEEGPTWLFRVQGQAQEGWDGLESTNEAASLWCSRAAGRLLHCAWPSEAPWTATHWSSLPPTVYWSLLRLVSIESVMLLNHLILCGPLLLLPSIFPSIRVFSKGSVLRIRRPKYWDFSFSISPSSEHPGLTSLGWTALIALIPLSCVKSRLWRVGSRCGGELSLPLMW